MRCNTTCTDELGELGVYCTIAINRVPPPSRYHSLMASDTVSIVGPDEFDPESQYSSTYLAAFNQSLRTVTECTIEFI